MHASGAFTVACTERGPRWQTHRPPKLENLRPPWPKGTSGNPAGYSRGRRISDAIERQIDEMELDREFGATAIAMALGKKHLLKQKVKDPETGEDIWVEQKPDLAWFKMIAQRIEPSAEQTDAVARLRAILDDIDSELPDPIDQGKAAESPERSRSHPCDCNENVESAEKLFQAEPARGDSGQVALKVLQTLPCAGNLVTSLAVERRFGHRRVPTLRGLLELFNPARHAVQLFAFLEAQVAGLFTGGVRRFLPGNIRIRPRSGGGLPGVLAEVVVVAFFHANGQLLPDRLPPTRLPSRFPSGKRTTTLRPCWPGPRFRYLPRCLHRKGPPLAYLCGLPSGKRTTSLRPG